VQQVSSGLGRPGEPLSSLSGPGQGGDELGQAVCGELAAFDRSGAGAESVDATSVVRLVNPEGHDAIGHARQEGLCGGAGSTVVDDGGHLWEEPPVRRLAKEVHVPAVPFGTSLEFTATESTTLIRASGTPLLETTDAGKVLDIALRLLAPLLLGLALLAVRGRTKR
jgi:hypothetical protein